MPFEHLGHGRLSLPLACWVGLDNEWSARCEQSFILLRRLLPPINVGELLECVRDLGVVQSQWDESALGVGGIAE